MTLLIDFPIHSEENNSESQQHKDTHEKKFSKKCIQLLQRLCTGERLQFANEVKTIGDLRRRSLDLIQAGIPVQREFIELNKEQINNKVVPIKEYFLKSEDIPYIYDKYKEFFQIDNQVVTK